MRTLLPEVTTPEEFETLRRDDARLLPGVRAIARGLGLGSSTVTRFPDGSLPVYALGDDQVLKLFPPYDLGERDTEAAVLRAVEGRLPVPSPEVHAVEDFEGWGYVLMSRLRGRGLAEAWPEIPAAARAGLATRLGEALAALHRVDPPEVEAVRVDWSAFVNEQRRTAAERQRRRGLPESWVEQIPEFLAGVDLGTPSPALLHTEIMREHLLVECVDGAWRLSGLFDFEPAMAGAPEYEFASVGLFFSCAEGDLLRRVFLAYGVADPALDAALEQRLLAYALLHRYSNLAWYLERLPLGPRVTTLAGLAASWWGVRGPR